MTPGAPWIQWRVCVEQLMMEKPRKSVKFCGKFGMARSWFHHSNQRGSCSRKTKGQLCCSIEPLGIRSASWRDVMEPHPDVAQGRYKNAEFAADLAQVARGEGAFEYRDPVEFFARTLCDRRNDRLAGAGNKALKRKRWRAGHPAENSIWWR